MNTKYWVEVGLYPLPGLKSLLKGDVNINRIRVQHFSERAKALAHAEGISAGGFKLTDTNGVTTYYPVHRVAEVKVVGG